MALPQLILIPVLYIVQEMTIRLGVLTGKGQGALIREYFGSRWGRLSASLLLLAGTGALLTEFAGIAGVGELFGIPRTVTVPVAVAFLVGITMTGSYRSVERIGVALGLAELAFIPAVLMAHPPVGSIVRSFAHMPIGNGSFMFLLAANVGAVIMPWMIFYQQGAVLDKGLRAENIRGERRVTAVGAVLTQVIMIAVVLAFGATIGRVHPGAVLNSVGEMSSALRPFIGGVGAKVLLGAGVLGAALVAGLVASLAGAWGVSEVFGWQHTLNDRPSRKTMKFYFVFCLANVVGAAIVLLSTDLVGLVIDVEVMNALLLPVVLGMLLALEARALPERYRMHGWYRAVATGLCLVVMGFGLYTAVAIISHA
jgi:Mn2+/Fe2+ NRAMP family transporter